MYIIAPSCYFNIFLFYLKGYSETLNHWFQYLIKIMPNHPQKQKFKRYEEHSFYSVQRQPLEMFLKVS